MCNACSMLIELQGFAKCDMQKFSIIIRSVGTDEEYESVKLSEKIHPFTAMKLFCLIL